MGNCFQGLPKKKSSSGPRQNFLAYVPRPEAEEKKVTPEELKDRLKPVNPQGQAAMVASTWAFGDKVPTPAELGKGAYGWVWRARDSQSNQIYAVKVMKSKTEVTKRENKLAEHLISLKHPCVVRLHSIIPGSADVCSLVMEFCPGGDLEKKIEEFRPKDCPYTRPPQWSVWVTQIFLGLRHLHLAAKMLVRDVKPGNVLLTDDCRRAKLTDFGMSRLAPTSDGQFTLAPNLPPGTPHYAAPEVINQKGYDFHADLYSFGVLTWVLLTGGVKKKKIPQPPCADYRNGLAPLANNWKLIKGCVNYPAENDAEPLPSEDAKNFVLSLTDRSEGNELLSHEDIRNHPLLRSLEIPSSDGDTLAEWLENFEKSPPNI